jgi:hypothetical protein
MFKITKDGDIIFPDGYVLSVPYEDENNRYLEYAAWVQAGNVPEVIEQD